MHSAGGMGLAGSLLSQEVDGAFSFLRPVSPCLFDLY